MSVDKYCFATLRFVCRIAISDIERDKGSTGTQIVIAITVVFMHVHWGEDRVVQTSCFPFSLISGRNMSIISIVDKSRSLSIVVASNQSTNIGS